MTTPNESIKKTYVPLERLIEILKSEKGYESINQIAEETDISAATIHAYCKALETSGLATKNQDGKYRIRIKDELYDQILEYFIDAGFTTTELSEEILKDKKAGKISGQIEKFSKEHIFKQSLQYLLEIFESEQLLYSYTTEGEGQWFELSKKGYSLKNACYQCYQKFDENDNTLVAQNVVVKVPKAKPIFSDDGSYTWQDGIGYASLKIHPRCLQFLSQSKIRKFANSRCSFCGLAISNKVFNEEIESNEPGRFEYRNLIIKNSNLEIQEGSSIYYKLRAVQDFPSIFGVNIPDGLRDEIRWDKTEYEFKINKKLSEIIIKNSTLRQKNKKWFQSLKQHDFKKFTQFTAKFLLPQIEIEGVSEVFSENHVAECLRDISKAMRKEFGIRDARTKASKLWESKEKKKIFAKCMQVINENKEAKKDVKEFFDTPVDNVFRSIEMDGNFDRGEIQDLSNQNDVIKEIDFSLIHRRGSKVYHRECYIEFLEAKKLELEVETLETELEQIKREKSEKELELLRKLENDKPKTSPTIKEVDSIEGVQE